MADFAVQSATGAVASMTASTTGQASAGQVPVKLRVGGQDYIGWQSCAIERSMESIAGTFDIPISWDARAAPPIKRQDAVQVLLGDTVVITGYVLAAEPFYKTSEVGLRVVGRDRTGDLVKCSALHKGGQWRGATVERIARDLLGAYQINVVVDTPVGEPIKDFKLQHGEPLVEALARAARLRGLLVTRNDAGALLLTRAGLAKHPGRIVGGRRYPLELGGGNVLEMQGMGTDENLHSSYTAFGQSHASSQADFEAAREIKARALDAEVRRHTPLVINTDGNVTQADLQTLVDHTARVRRGQAYALRYRLEGWAANGVPWSPNMRVAIYDDVAGLHGDEWLISSTKHSCDIKDGCTTDVVVKPIEAYASAPLQTRQRRGWTGNKQGRAAR